MPNILLPDVNGTTALQWRLGDPNAGVNNSAPTNFVTFITTLTASVALTDTTITVVAAVSMAVNVPILVDSEYMLVTAINGLTVTVKRGYFNSVIATHSNGANVNISQDVLITNGGGYLSYSSLQITGAIIPGSGAGGEIYYDATTVHFNAYDHGAGVYKQLELEGSGIFLNFTTNNPVTFGTGLVKLGQLQVSANVSPLQASPAATVAIFANVDGTGTRLTVDNYGGAGNLTFRRADNTAASPNALASGDDIGAIVAIGYTGAAYSGAQARILMTTTQVWTSANNGSKITLSTTPNNSTTLTLALTIDQDQSATFAGIIAANAGATIASNLKHTGTGFSVFNAATAGQQVGGAKTAGATYGANEQSMLQIAYNALRTYGLLT